MTPVTPGTTKSTSKPRASRSAHSTPSPPPGTDDSSAAPVGPDSPTKVTEPDALTLSVGDDLGQLIISRNVKSVVLFSPAKSDPEILKDLNAAVGEMVKVVMINHTEVADEDKVALADMIAARVMLTLSISTGRFLLHFGQLVNELDFRIDVYTSLFVQGGRLFLLEDGLEKVKAENEKLKGQVALLLEEVEKLKADKGQAEVGK